MKRIREAALLSAIGVCLVAVCAISWHSVEEIHYLKTFYPRHFTVQEAWYATLVELVKVALAIFPLLLIGAAALLLLRRYDKGA
jgi:hypothetical protein